MENLEQERKAKGDAIDESKQEEEEKLGQGIEQLNRLERLGSNRDSSRVPPRRPHSTFR